MKKFFTSLPFILLVAVVAGILVGLVANEAVMNVVVTVKYVLGQVIMFCVPLIIIGFIAPSIIEASASSRRALWAWLCHAHCSSIALRCSRCSPVTRSFLTWVYRHVIDGPKSRPISFHPTSKSCLQRHSFPSPFGLIVYGRPISCKLPDEFQRIVLAIVTRVVIPILPFFIAIDVLRSLHMEATRVSCPCSLRWCLLSSSAITSGLLFCTESPVLIRGENPLKVLRQYGPGVFDGCWHHVIRCDARRCASGRKSRCASAASRYGVSGIPAVRQHPFVWLGAHG